MIHVPYHSQQEYDPLGYRNESELPVIMSLLGWQPVIWHYNHTPPQYNPGVVMRHLTSAAAWAALAPYVLPFTLAETLEGLDLPMRYTCTGMRAIRHELDEGRPVVALVWYGAFGDRQNLRFTGYDQEEVILHDSNWYKRTPALSNDGTCQHVPLATFMAGFGFEGAAHLNQPPFQAIFVVAKG